MFRQRAATAPSTLAHYGLFIGPLDGLLRRPGVIEASRENAAAALHSGAVVLVLPGGDYDSYRPTFSANTIDVTGRFGNDPDVDEVDAHVRAVMESALKRLAAERRFPVLG